MTPVIIIDNVDGADTIQAAFADYYRRTILAEETDPDNLHDMKAPLDSNQVHADTQGEKLVARHLRHRRASLDSR